MTARLAFLAAMAMGVAGCAASRSGVRTLESVSSDRRYSLAGHEALRVGDIEGASRYYDRAVDLGDADPATRAIQARLHKIGWRMPPRLGMAGDALARSAVIKYARGEELSGAVEQLRYEYHHAKTGYLLQGLLNLIECEAGTTITPEPPCDFCFIDQKLYDARQAVYDGKFALAIQLSRDIIAEEPCNITALEIQGSAYYLSEEKEKARSAWLRVLRLQPDNRIVSSFLKQAL